MIITENDIGSWYLTRNGSYAEINHIIRNQRKDPVRGRLVHGTHSSNGLSWLTNGRYMVYREDRLDLIRKLDALELELLGLNDVKR